MMKVKKKYQHEQENTKVKLWLTSTCVAALVLSPNCGRYNKCFLQEAVNRGLKAMSSSFLSFLIIIHIRLLHGFHNEN